MNGDRAGGSQVAPAQRSERAMNDAAMTKVYEQLTPVERFRLAIEAMSRRDWLEVDRLEDTCPRRTYRCEDAEFRDRMRRVHLIALYHALWVEGPLAKLR